MSWLWRCSPGEASASVCGPKYQALACPGAKTEGRQAAVMSDEEAGAGAPQPVSQHRFRLYEESMGGAIDEHEAKFLGRLLSKVHFELLLFPKRLVEWRLGEDNDEALAHHDDDMRWWMRLKLMCTLLAVVLLPLLYANTMPYKCSTEDYLYERRSPDCIDGWHKNPRCVREFTYKGDIIVGCTSEDAAHGSLGNVVLSPNPLPAAWCSESPAYNGSWLECRRCSQERLTGEQTAAIAMRQVGCDLQDHLRSPLLGSIFGIIIAGCSLGGLLLVGLANMLLQKLYASTKEEVFLRVKRRMFQPLLWLWYYKVGWRLKKMRHHNAVDIFPCLYSPPSLLACFLYLSVVGEMLWLGWMEGRLALGCIMAWGSGELLLLMLSITAAARDDTAALYSAYIRSWLPPGRPFGSRTILHRLEEELMEVHTTWYCTLEELYELRALAKQSRADQKYQRHMKDGTINDVCIIEKVVFRAEGKTWKINLLKNEMDEIQHGKAGKECKECKA